MEEGSDSDSLEQRLQRLAARRREAAAAAATAAPAARRAASSDDDGGEGGPPSRPEQPPARRGALAALRELLQGQRAASDAAVVVPDQRGGACAATSMPARQLGGPGHSAGIGAAQPSAAPALGSCALPDCSSGQIAAAPPQPACLPDGDAAECEAQVGGPALPLDVQPACAADQARKLAS